MIANEIAALKNGTQIALFDQNWPQQAAFGAVACAYFFKYGKILPNTQHLTVITKANLAAGEKKLADITSYAQLKGKTFAVCHGRRPAIVLDLVGSTYDRLVVTVDDPEHAMRSLAR